MKTGTKGDASHVHADIRYMAIGRLTGTAEHIRADVDASQGSTMVCQMARQPTMAATDLKHSLTGFDVARVEREVATVGGHFQFIKKGVLGG